MDISKYRDNIELSDVCIVVGDHEYKLHKFPLCINCEYFKEQCKNQSQIVLKRFPGDWQYFEFIADHCYGKEVEINEINVVTLFCAADVLGMHGKHNMIEKCQKVIDRIFRSVEFSKSIELLLPLLESAEKLKNENVQAIIKRGLMVIINLWLRHGSNYKANLKEVYFEDTLVFDELLKLKFEWIEGIIKICSADENKYQYAGKLAVQYIQTQIIDYLDATKLININKPHGVEKEKNDISLIDSSNCSSPNEIEKSQVSSSSYEKDDESIFDGLKKCPINENLGELFDKVVFCLPDNMNIGKTVSVLWFQKCLEVCQTYKCKSKSKFFKLCSGILMKVSTDEIKMINPNSLSEMIEHILKNDEVDKDLMKWIWDNRFLEMANNDELDPTVFSKVVKNMPESHDLDPDVVFQIVLLILNKIGENHQEYQMDLIDCVKLDRITPENLEIAMKSKFWNLEDVCNAAINRLKLYDKDSLTEKTRHKSFNTQYSPYDDLINEIPSRTPYQSEKFPTWKEQSKTSHYDVFHYEDDDYYAPKSYDTLSRCYHSPYRHYDCIYSPDSYLTIEENLKTELKKISDSYINYYKERFPLKSRRRYHHSIPFDF